jgi:hypothetical protein
VETRPLPGTGPPSVQNLKTDAQGRFEFVPYVGNFHTITAYPPDGTPYLLRSKNLTWPKADAVRHHVKMELVRGVVLKATVTEAGSGRPVELASAQFMARVDDNPFYRGDVFDQHADWGKHVSGKDGKFEIVVLPGPGHLLIDGPTTDYLHEETTSHKLTSKAYRPNRRYYADAVVPYNLKPGAGTHEVTIQLRRGVTVRGRLEGPDGKPAASAKFLCRTYIPVGHDLNGVHSREAKDGTFDLPGCDPEKAVQVFFFDAAGDAGAMAELSGKQAKEPVTVRLQRCGSIVARIVDANGKPVVGARVHLEIPLTPGVSFWSDEETEKESADVAFTSVLDRRHNNDFRTDAAGRVTLPGLIPGVTYRLVANAPGGRYRVLRDFTMTAERELDLKDLTYRGAN